MKKYRFYIAWMDGSDGACGDETKVNRADDLIPQFKAGNENVNTFEVEAENEEIALAYGYQKAFFANFTAQDTLTDIEEIT